MATTTFIEPAAKVPRAEEPLFEVVRGRRVELPPMGAYPTVIASFLHLHLGPFVRQHALGVCVVELLFLIDPKTNLQRRPDVAFVSSERWPLRRPIPNTASWNVVPDLAVEVVSPMDRAEELLEKVREFFQTGTRVVWVIYPKQKLAHVFESWTSVRVLTRADELDGGAVVPGFKLPLTQLFREEDEEPDGTAETPETPQP